MKGRGSACFPEKVPEYYRELSASVPALRAAYEPSAAEEETDSDAFGDPIGESTLSPAAFLIRKLKDRALYLASSSCAVHCRFCFRRASGLFRSPDPTPDHLQEAVKWVREHREVEEVILSGGDPLALTEDKLRAAVSAFSSIPTVARLRIHTRRPVADPGASAPLLATAARVCAKPLTVVMHVAHPGELTPRLRRLVHEMREMGIATGSQTVLLNTINADPTILSSLFEACAEHHLPSRYLHHPDRVDGGRAFRLPLARGLEIYSACHGKGKPPYVIDLPNGSGKARVETLKAIEKEDGRHGKRTRYRWERPEGWDAVSPASVFEWWDIEG